MKNENELKQIVKEKYSQIATMDKVEGSSCCSGSTGCCGDDIFNNMAEDYSKLKGYNPDADLGLGCGLPTEFAGIKPGDIVIDLGSGAGNDCFIARSLTGEKGKVIGIDFSEAMIAKARNNVEKIGFTNVEFRFGEIESLPVVSNYADVVVSNCVLNLIPNKYRVFSEIYRVLKPGAHISISDIVLQGELPSELIEAAELYAGCVSGAIQKEEYFRIIEEAGFVNIKIQKEKTIALPKEILSNYLGETELNILQKANIGIRSVTVYGEKPAKDDRNCCEPGSGCC